MERSWLGEMRRRRRRGGGRCDYLMELVEECPIEMVVRVRWYPMLIKNVSKQARSASWQ